ncbi:MAG: alpha-mannosidase, partial [Kovacikia sp.]
IALIWWAEGAQIFVNGQLVQEGDLFDCSTRLLLSHAVTPGEEFTIALRLVSPGHDDGALVRSLCLYEAPNDNAPLEPGFIADELAVLQIYLETFAPDQLEFLAASVAQVDWSLLPNRSRFDQSLAELRDRLLPLSNLIKQRTIKLLGHAHLDMAWLWTVDDTWLAAERTFESVLKLQQDFPELIFCHSTPALYEWIEQNRPDLFQRIQQQVAVGLWEPIGGLWVEPELNIISGEAIARHLLYGQRYLQEKFGTLSPIAWLPDSFGFNWQLPQLLKQGGIHYFVTQKLRWNDTTKFPYEVFKWRSPDGTEVFSLMSAPIGEGIDPVKMATYACAWETQTGIPLTLWLPGVGDHGGGPTRDMLEVTRRWQRSPFFPQLEFSTALEYLQDIEAVSELNPASGVTADGPNRPISAQKITHQAPGINSQPQPPTLPLWNSDLYLEFHRGCYTTHASQKVYNRNAERLLYQAELWASLAAMTVGTPYPRCKLEWAWKKVLFNQFHDILPGSSITPVMIDANDGWAKAEEFGREVLDGALHAISAKLTLPSLPDPTAKPIIIFNSLNWERSTIVEHPRLPNQNVVGVYDSHGQSIEFERTSSDKFLFQAHHIPAIGYQVFWICQEDVEQLTPATVAAKDFVLENQILQITINAETGDLASVFDKINQREVLSAPGNQLQAFVDKGQYWDAWNIDPAYAQHRLPATQLQKIQWIEKGPLRSRVRVIRKINQSTFQQDYILERESPLLKIETFVDWQERHVLVKAAFPLNLETDYATYEIPCGVIRRSTKPASDREKAQWEVPAMHWADLSNENYGVSLLNNCKYGYDAQPNQLRLTLLRSPEFPDPEADKGHHSFTYALYPHAGDWKA